MTLEWSRKLARKETKKDDEDDLKGKLHEENLGLIYTTPSVACSLTLKTLHSDADWRTMLEQLKRSNKDVIEGDLTIAEAMLIDQAQVLQSIFLNMTGLMHTAVYISKMEAYGRMALRAQNQCQRTLRTLLEYKNPKRVTFIKQQNNLQINEAEKSEKKVKPANELLEHDHESRLDIGKTQETIGSDQEVEAVGKIDRAED